MKAVALARMVVPGAIAILLSACSKPVEISLGTVGNTMVYSTSTLTVRSGQTVHPAASWES